MDALLFENAQFWLTWLILPGAVVIVALIYICRSHVSWCV